MNTGLKRKTKIEAEKRRKEVVALIGKLTKNKFEYSRICKDNAITYQALYYWMAGSGHPSKKHLKKLNRYYLKVTTTKTKKQK